MAEDDAIEYPILREEIEHMDLRELIDKCDELHIYDKKCMKSDDDLKSALKTFLDSKNVENDVEFLDKFNRDMASILEKYEKLDNIIKERLSKASGVICRTKKDLPDLFQSLNVAYNGEVVEMIENRTQTIGKERKSIVVIGEVSAGKTSFINNLLGTTFLPTGFVHCTAVICRIRYGVDRKVELLSEKGEVFYQTAIRNDEDVGPVLNRYVNDTSMQNEDEVSEHKYVDVYAPIPLLKGNLEIIDTPGFNEKMEYQEHIRKYLEKAAAVIIILDASNSGGVRGDTEKYLSQLTKESKICFSEECIFDDNRNPTLFVLNKWDTVKNEKDIQDVLTEVNRKLGKFLTSGECNFLTLDSRNDKAVRTYNGKKLCSKSFKILAEHILRLVENYCKVSATSHLSWLWNLHDKTYEHTIPYLHHRTQKDRPCAASVSNQLKVIKEKSAEIKGKILKEIEDVITEHVHYTTDEFMRLSFRKSLAQEVRKHVSKFWNSINYKSKLQSLLQAEIKEHISSLTESRYSKRIIGKIQNELDQLDEAQGIKTRKLMTSKNYTELSRFGWKTIVEGGTYGSFKLFKETPVSQIFLRNFAKILGRFNVFTIVTDVIMNYTLSNAEDLVRGNDFIEDLVWEEYVANYLAIENEEVKIKIVVRSLYKDFIDFTNGPLIEQIKKVIADREVFITNMVKDVKNADVTLCKSLLESQQQSLHYVLRKLCTLHGLQYDASIKEKKVICTGQCYKRWKIKTAGLDSNGVMLTTSVVNFRNEIKVWKQIRQLIRKNENVQNILTLRGFYFTNSEQEMIGIVVEDFHSSLHEVLKSVGTCSQTNSFAFYKTVVQGVVTGLEFLHNAEVGHRNLCIENVMIAEGNTPKLMGIGSTLSKGLDNFPAVRTHLAPERLKPVPKTLCSPDKEDIYSLAIMMWEMWYGRQAYVEEVKDEKESKLIEIVVERKERPNFPSSETIRSPGGDLQEIIRIAWQPAPIQRGTLQDILRKFEKIKDYEIATDHRIPKRVTAAQAAVQKKL